MPEASCAVPVKRTLRVPVGNSARASHVVIHRETLRWGSKGAGEGCTTKLRDRRRDKKKRDISHFYTLKGVTPLVTARATSASQAGQISGPRTVGEHGEQA